MVYSRKKRSVRLRRVLRARNDNFKYQLILYIVRW